MNPSFRSFFQRSLTLPSFCVFNEVIFESHGNLCVGEKSNIFFSDDSLIFDELFAVMTFDNIVSFACLDRSYKQLDFHCWWAIVLFIWLVRNCQSFFDVLWNAVLFFSWILDSIMRSFLQKKILKLRNLKQPWKIGIFVWNNLLSNYYSKFRIFFKIEVISWSYTHKKIKLNKKKVRFEKVALNLSDWAFMLLQNSVDVHQDSKERSIRFECVNPLTI